MPRLEAVTAMTLFAVFRRFWPFAPIVFVLVPVFAFPQTDAAAASERVHAGESALEAQHLDEAAQEFRAALRFDPQNAEARAGLGTLDWMRGDCAAARTDLREALKAQPSNMEVESLLGICEKRLADTAADTHLETAFSQLKDSKVRIEVGVELGDLYYQRGDIDHALPVVRALVAMAPENIDILFFAQHVYQQMADETMNKLALIAPASARMQQLIAEHLVNAGDLKGAAEHYREALRIDPALPGAHFELAEAIVEAAPGDSDAQSQGRQELEAALRQDGESARLECELGRVAYLHGDFDVALAHYERAYAINPREIEAQMGVGRILLTENKPQQAVRYLNEAVAEDPLNAEAHYHDARALKALHRDADAQREMQAFQTVRHAQGKVRELYMQMNMRADARAGQLPADEGSEP
jgi:tetratricopeptide (TPR) repeat protein